MPRLTNILLYTAALALLTLLPISCAASQPSFHLGPVESMTLSWKVAGVQQQGSPISSDDTNNKPLIDQTLSAINSVAQLDEIDKALTPELGLRYLDKLPSLRIDHLDGSHTLIRPALTCESVVGAQPCSLWSNRWAIESGGALHGAESKDLALAWFQACHPSAPQTVPTPTGVCFLLSTAPFLYPSSNRIALYHFVPCHLSNQILLSN
ncbi:MAG: hypothetical protein FJ320_08710 [SAR202 cluster bacterium]|nr:hypothetical protein [SAR202 cluster bacterium]